MPKNGAFNRLMQGIVARHIPFTRLQLEESRPARPRANLIQCRFADAFDLQTQPNRNACQRVVAVQNDVFGVDVCHHVDHVFGHVGVAAFGHGAAFKGQAFFDFSGKEGAGLQKDELVVEVAKGFFGLQMQVQLVAGLVALQGFLHFFKQVVAADQKLDGFVEHIQFSAQSIFQRPSQGDNALFGDFHTTIVA